jgi:hypothetical protein
VLPPGRERLRDQSFAAHKRLGPVQTGSASHSAHRMRRSAKMLSEAVYSVIHVIRMARVLSKAIGSPAKPLDHQSSLSEMVVLSG